MEGPSDHAKSEKHENGVLVDDVGSEKTSTEDNCTKDIAVPEKVNLDSGGSGCKLGTDINKMSVDSEKIVPFFMSRGWGDTLCRCERCVNFYAWQGVAYLIDKEDSIEEYEKIAKQKRLKKLEQQEGAETNFLNSQKPQKEELFDLSKPVTSEDVRAVFENLVKKKKQRLS